MHISYYMSYSTADTYEVPVLKDQAPRASMLPLLWPFSTFMGSFAHDGFNSSWWQNDGIDILSIEKIIDRSC